MPDGMEPLDELVPATDTVWDVAGLLLDDLGAWKPKAVESRPYRCRSDADNAGLLEAWRSGERLDDDDARQLRDWAEWRQRRARDREENLGRLACLLGTMQRLRAEGDPGRDWYVRLAKHLFGAWKLSVDEVDEATQDWRRGLDALGRDRPWEA